MTTTATTTATTTTTHTVQIPSQIHHAADTENTRYAIAGANVVTNDGHTKAYATNGRILAAVDCSGLPGDSESTPSGSALVHLDSLPRLKTRRGLRLVSDGDTITHSLDRHGDHADLIEGRFPPIEDIWPKAAHDSTDAKTVSDKTAFVTLGVDHLRDLLASITDDRAASRIDGRQPEVTFAITAPNQPVVVMSNVGMGLIMPITGSEPSECVDMYADRRQAIVDNLSK